MTREAVTATIRPATCGTYFQAWRTRAVAPNQALPDLLMRERRLSDAEPPTRPAPLAKSSRSQFSASRMHITVCLAGKLRARKLGQVLLEPVNVGPVRLCRRLPPRRAQRCSTDTTCGATSTLASSSR